MPPANTISLTRVNSQASSPVGAVAQQHDRRRVADRPAFSPATGLSSRPRRSARPRPARRAAARRHRPRTGRAARVAEDLAEQLAGAVDHLRLAGEGRVRRDEPDDLHDAHHASRPTNASIARARSARTARHASASSGVTSAPTLPVAGITPSTIGTWPGGVDQRAGADGRDVGRHRRDDGWQRDPEFGQPGTVWAWCAR